MVWVRVHRSLVRYRAFLKIAYPVPAQRPIFGTRVRQTLVLGTLFALGFGQQRMNPNDFDKNSTFGIGKTVVRRGKKLYLVRNCPFVVFHLQMGFELQHPYLFNSL